MVLSKEETLAKEILESFGFVFEDSYEEKDWLTKEPVLMIGFSDPAEPTQFAVDFEFLIDARDLGKTAGDIINWSTWFSCCGDEVDHDIPLCPTCKEWVR